MDNLGQHFSYSGRTSRRGYLATAVASWIIWGVMLASVGMSVAELASGNLGADELAIASGIQLVVIFATFVLTGWLNTSAATRRLHDFGWSAKSFLWMLLPIVGPLILSFALLFKSGTRGPNKFGPNPRSTSLKQTEIDASAGSQWRTFDDDVPSASLDAALERRLAAFRSEQQTVPQPRNSFAAKPVPASTVTRSPHRINRPAFGKR